MEELQVIETTSGRQFKPWATKDDVQDPASVTAIASEIASGKQAIASAINAKGGSADPLESFQQLADDIVNLNDSFITYGVEVTEKIHWLRFICDSGTVPRLPLTAIDDDVVTTISQPNVFQHCTSLESVKMPALTTISGERVFQHCSALQEVNMPNLTTISGDYAFYECHSLLNVNLNALATLSGAGCFYRCYSIAEIYLPNLILIQGPNTFQEMTSLKRCYLPQLTQITQAQTFRGINKIEDIVLGTLISLKESFWDGKPNLRNITIGQDTNINLPFQNWTATNVIAEGQSGITELNSNLYNNLLTKLYDHSQDGVTRTLRLGWLANVTAENIAYANAKGWTLTT